MSSASPDLNVLRTASCSCEQLKLSCVGEPIRAAVCHCYECQKRTGSVFGVQCRYHRDQVEISGECRRYVRTGDSGGEVTFSFCGTCGSTVFWKIKELEEYVMVAVGNISENNRALPVPCMSVYEDRAHSWVTLPDSMEKYD